MLPESLTAKPRERLVVAMSGGVDSSVAAALLCQEGYEVVGVTMQLSGDASRLSGDASRLSGDASRCCSLEDADDARRVADRLGIRFFVANYARQFREEVIEPFADAYLSGRTPIPCVTCNSRFKFEHLMSRAEVFGADTVATGHYARIEFDAATGRARLFRARDQQKDQSYFLFELTQRQLAKARFPLGEMSKHEVRKLARELGLATADKAESQEICFVPDGDYAAVVELTRGFIALPWANVTVSGSAIPSTPSAPTAPTAPTVLCTSVASIRRPGGSLSGIARISHRTPPGSTT